MTSITPSGPAPTSTPTLHVLIGLPASGKTAYARQLTRQAQVLRLSPDEWMLPLFGESEAGGRRDVMEGRLIALAVQVLRLGVDVVLDFGVWSRDERTALRALAAELGVRCRLVYLPIEPDEQWARVRARFEQSPESTFPLTVADLAGYRELFQPPDDSELATGTPLDPPPAGSRSWADWTTSRWPAALPLGD